MNYRELIMYTEIGCFVLCVSGWILVCSTMPTEYWNYSSIDGIVLTTANYFSNLWKSCISDSTGVSDCKEFPSLLALPEYIHACRALIITGIILGFFGGVLALIGMKCTKIGGSEIANARVTFAAGVNYLIAGLTSMIAFSWYGNKIRAEFVDPNFKAQKYEIGAAVFVGWGGSTLLIVGGLVYCIFAGRDGLRSRSNYIYKSAPYKTASTTDTYRRPPRVVRKGKAILESRDNRSRILRSFDRDAYV
ncbi:claudin-10-like isoform X1 [Lepisosteus oculatus]|uniref:claudin-10-like isoform X1 n=2 Tax=Lepisosteus oculatus TaxID=7918 RepID=UPI00073FC972|nr:PREDICTED: claudin-10-like isoform X1 [Lepisosteus oculatus]